MSKLACNKLMLQHFFEDSVKKFPKNIALICDGQSLTYEELNKETNKLANYLKKQNITPNDPIGILLERSINSYIAILAILKIGATYVPIETEYPDDRINYIFSDMSLKTILTSSSQCSRKLSKVSNTIIFDNIRDKIVLEDDANIEINQTENLSENLAYVIYTSGSTGRPKGVEIPHKSICHYVNSSLDIYKIKPEDRVYQGFSLSFDASLEEIWMAFANGATLVACTDKSTRSGLNLIEFLNENRISVLSTIPTLLSTLENNLPNLRLLIVGGEVCNANLLKKWSRSNLRIINTYGPTEASVITTYAECQVGKTVTIGKPLPGYEIIIVDENLQPVASDCAGELCISGHALARGYVNRPDITAEKFIPHPHNPKQKIYRSGDLAKITSSGDIQFLGRIDSQIKLRGFRIELNEIEAIINSYPDIKQAIVALKTVDEQQVLVAYYILEKNVKFNVAQLKKFLISKLPHFMIPSLYEEVNDFICLANGKVDRNHLPEPTTRELLIDYIAPKSDLEKQIANVWQEVFHLPRISIKADFFLDLGGHSLFAATVVSKLRKLPGLERLSVKDIYDSKNIERLAKKFSSGANDTKKVEQDINIVSSWKYGLCAIGQFFGCLLQFSIRAWDFLIIALCYIYFSNHNVFFSLDNLYLLIILFLGIPVFSILLTVSIKWLLLGRVKPGKYPLWGWFYFRWWLVDRLVNNLFSPKTVI